MQAKTTPNFLLDAQTAPFMWYAESEFFAAMKLGYASENPDVYQQERFNSGKSYLYTLGHLTLKDTYYTVPESNRSSGYTVIHWGPVPLWMMFYSGEYTKDAIPCLKAALRVNYEQSKFEGGRGPTRGYLHRGYMYTNKAHGDFSNFHGEETIYGPGNVIAGYHRYHGLYLATKA